MTAEPLVECRDLSKSFVNGGVDRRVLESVDCRVEPGRLIALMGPSGSGKSTLLNIMGGLQAPTSGSVVVAGRQLAGMGDDQLSDFRARTVGFIFQEWNLLADLTVLENVMLPLRLAGGGARAAERQALDALESLGLRDHAGKFPELLSGGEQQRVAILRAVVDDRPLVLADEPTGSLDQESGAKVMALLRQVTEGRGRSALVATHDPVVAAACDEVWRLVDGRIVEQAAA